MALDDNKLTAPWQKKGNKHNTNNLKGRLSNTNEGDIR